MFGFQIHCGLAEMELLMPAIKQLDTILATSPMSNGISIICKKSTDAKRARLLLRSVVQGMSVDFGKVQECYIPAEDIADVEECDAAEREARLPAAPNEKEIYEAMLKNDKDIIANKDKIIALKDGIIDVMKKHEAEIRASYEKRLREQTKEINRLEAELRRMERRSLTEGI